MAREKSTEHRLRNTDLEIEAFTCVFQCNYKFVVYIKMYINLHLENFRHFELHRMISFSFQFRTKFTIATKGWFVSYCQSLSPSLSPSLSLSLSLLRIQRIQYTYIFSLSLSLTHTYTYTYTHCFFLSLSLSQCPTEQLNMTGKRKTILSNWQPLKKVSKLLSSTGYSTNLNV